MEKLKKTKIKKCKVLNFLQNKIAKQTNLKGSYMERTRFVNRCFCIIITISLLQEKVTDKYGQ